MSRLVRIAAVGGAAGLVIGLLGRWLGVDQPTIYLLCFVVGALIGWLA